MGAASGTRRLSSPTRWRRTTANASGNPLKRPSRKRDWRADGDPIDGTSATTRARDRRGAVTEVSAHLQGWLMTPGSLSGTADWKVHGAVLVGGPATLEGQVDIWFDASLETGAFPPPEWGLPRVVALERTVD